VSKTSSSDSESPRGKAPRFVIKPCNQVVTSDNLNSIFMGNRIHYLSHSSYFLLVSGSHIFICTPPCFKIIKKAIVPRHQTPISTLKETYLHTPKINLRKECIKSIKKVVVVHKSLTRNSARKCVRNSGQSNCRKDCCCFRETGIRNPND
jgi:hypothetical protein